MIRRSVTLPELGLVAGTRAAMGIGIGLLIADRLDPVQRRAAGWTLLGIGVLTTPPLLAQILFGEAEREFGRGVDAVPSRRDRSPGAGTGWGRL